MDETREDGTWAGWLDVPRHVFSPVFGAVIARGLDYRETFQVFQPGFDLYQARQQRADEGLVVMGASSKDSNLRSRLRSPAVRSIEFAYPACLDPITQLVGRRGHSAYIPDLGSVLP